MSELVLVLDKLAYELWFTFSSRPQQTKDLAARLSP